MPILSGAAWSVIVKLPIVSRLIGPTLSDVLSATSVATGIDLQFKIRARAQGLVSGLVSKAGLAGVKTELAGQPARVSLGQDLGMLSEPERRLLATYKVAA